MHIFLYTYNLSVRPPISATQNWRIPPEETLAALIAEAKTNFDGIFAALKNELVHYLLCSDQELLAGPKYAKRAG